MRCILIGLVVAASWAAAGAGPVSADDLQPKTGRGTAPPNARGNGPWATRVMLATSSNGVDFVRLNHVLSDQAGVPNVVVDHDGRARVYYVDFGNGNIIACAVQRSATNLAGWTFHRVRITGAEGEPKPVDPTVVALPDHRYRLYFMQARPRPTIFSAISSNGLDFAREPGIRYDGSDSAGRPQPVFDPLVVKIDEGWLFWCGPAGKHSAHSSNGLNFTPTGPFKMDGAQFMPWSAVALPNHGGYRLYGNFIGPGEWGGGISSVYSADGRAWTREAGARLSLDGSKYRLEAGVLPDNGCAVLPDGQWLMAYLATIPIPRGSR